MANKKQAKTLHDEILDWESWHRSDPTPRVYEAFFTAWDGDDYAASEKDFNALNALSSYETYGEDPNRALDARLEKIEAISIFSPAQRVNLANAYRERFQDTYESGRFSGFMAGNASLLGDSNASARLELLRMLKEVHLSNSSGIADTAVANYIHTKGENFRTARFSERLHLTRPDLYPVCNEKTIEAISDTFPQIALSYARNYLPVARALRRACAEEEFSSLAVLDRYITKHKKLPRIIDHRAAELLASDAEEAGSIDVDGLTATIFIEKSIGSETVRLHRRNQKLAIEARRRADGVCCVCHVHTKSRYGVDLIEIHHRERFADIDPNTHLRTDDVAALCPNCHRAIHSLSHRGSLLSPEELATQLNPQTASREAG